MGSGMFWYRNRYEIAEEDLLWGCWRGDSPTDIHDDLWRGNIQRQLDGGRRNELCPQGYSFCFMIKGLQTLQDVTLVVNMVVLL